MRQLKLGRMLDTLPERLILARQRHLSHAAFLELVLADEATRRDTSSAARRARDAGLDPAMHLETWDETAAVRYDRTLWTDLTSLRFLDGPHGALLLGAVGVGKTHLATALGHIAVRRRIPTLMLRADSMFKRLKASRLDNSTEAEMRRLAQVGYCSSTTSPCSPWTPPRPPTSTNSSSPATTSLHRADLQPDPRRMAGHHERPAAGPIRRRPPHLHRPRTRHRRTVLPAPPEALS